MALETVAIIVAARLTTFTDNGWHALVYVALYELSTPLKVPLLDKPHIPVHPPLTLRGPVTLTAPLAWESNPRRHRLNRPRPSGSP